MGAPWPGLVGCSQAPPSSLSLAPAQPPRVDITYRHSWLQLVNLLQLVTAGLSLLQLVTACHSLSQLVTAGDMLSVSAYRVCWPCGRCLGWRGPCWGHPSHVTSVYPVSAVYLAPLCVALTPAPVCAALTGWWRRGARRTHHHQPSTQHSRSRHTGLGTCSHAHLTWAVWLAKILSVTSDFCISAPISHLLLLTVFWCLLILIDFCEMKR